MDELERVVAQIYEERGSVWSQAGSTARIFLEQVAQQADPTQEYGYFVSDARVKSKARAVAKIRQKCADRNEDLPTSMDMIERKISDWVGLKITANTTADALGFIDKLEKICRNDAQMRFDKKDGVDDIVDYIKKPKPSGYRAYHAVLLVSAYQNARQRDVRVEVQVKTRLQDAWGELTHESFYKNGDRPPPQEFHNSIARTMADLLATVDKLANDLARELNPTAVVEKEDLKESELNAHSEPIIETVKIIFVHPRYALAVGSSDQDRGLIPTSEFRKMLIDLGRVESDAYISVDDYLTEGDLVLAIREDGKDEGSRLFHPVRLE